MAISPKLRKALRGGFGYRAQREAWDAVAPGWRPMMRLHLKVGDLSRKEHARLLAWFGPFRDSEDPVIVRAWWAFRNQCYYRKHPYFGGWFPR